MERVPALCRKETAVITGITEITQINTKQDMSRWTRAHEKVPGIRWSVFAGPGGTMIIVEHEEDRCSLSAGNASAELPGTEASLASREASLPGGADILDAGPPDPFAARPSLA
jgi:hypothetical protein